MARCQIKYHYEMTRKIMRSDVWNQIERLSRKVKQKPQSFQTGLSRNPTRVSLFPNSRKNVSLLSKENILKSFLTKVKRASQVRFTHIWIVCYVVVGDLNVLLDVSYYFVQLLFDTFLLNLLVSRLKISGKEKFVHSFSARSLILDNLLQTNDDGQIQTDEIFNYRKFWFRFVNHRTVTFNVIYIWRCLDGHHWW